MLKGIAGTIFEDLVGGEGRMMEPMTEELLFIWQRTSWSAGSSKTNGWWTRYKSVHLLEGSEDRSVKAVLVVFLLRL